MAVILWILIAILLLFGVTAFIGAPYVPTHKKELNYLFSELYPLSKSDTLLDIGSGDGVVLLAAAKAGARVVGYEINPLLVWVSRFRLRRYSRAQVLLCDFWRTPLPNGVTVVYTFGESRDIVKMYQRIQNEATRLNKTIHFISYGFAIPGQKSIRAVRAHHLYVITPLQSAKA